MVKKKKKKKKKEEEEPKLNLQSWQDSSWWSDALTVDPVTNVLYSSMKEVKNKQNAFWSTLSYICSNLKIKEY